MDEAACGIKAGLMNQPIPDFPQAADLDACMGVDRYGLRRRLQGLRKRAKAGQPYDQGLNKLLRDIESSQQRRSQRPGART
jgi:ATP-dependent helicase HrpA